MHPRFTARNTLAAPTTDSRVSGVTRNANSGG